MVMGENFRRRVRDGALPSVVREYVHPPGTKCPRELSGSNVPMRCASCGAQFVEEDFERWE